MIISRQLCIALLISFLWHLFWMFSVSIVFLPGGFRVRQYSYVDFLGSILRIPAPLSHKRELAEVPAEIDMQGPAPFSERPYISLPLERKIFNPDTFVDVDTRQVKAFSVEDLVPPQKAAAGREVIFQPPIREYPEWAGSRQFWASSLIFKIYISADGLVQEITNVQGSGNPEIDTALARYVRKWRFAPAFDSGGQWQIIEVDVK